MIKAYSTIVTFKATGEELSFSSIKRAVNWLNANYPQLHLQTYLVYAARLTEGNFYETDEISIRKIRRIDNY